MKLSALQSLISEAVKIAEECQQKYCKTDENFQCADEENLIPLQLRVQIQAVRRDSAFCALDSLCLARDIFQRLGYLEED